MNLDRATIVGPGLIGGSLGLALKSKRLVRHVVGVGRREASLRGAAAVGAVDSWTLELAEGVKDADWVILATRVGLIREMGVRAIPAMKSGAVISDVGSTKVEIVSAIESHLRSDILFVGMHPLAGSERRGIQAANAGLFAGAVCILIRTRRTDLACLRAVSDVWRALGSQVVVMSPEKHDALLAQVSHLPHIIAACLMNSIDGPALRYGAGGLKSTTRTAASDPELWVDIFRSNRRNLLASIEQFEEALEDIRGCLSIGDDKALLALLKKAQEKRRSLEPQSNR